MGRLIRRAKATTVGRGVVRYGEAKGQRWAVVIAWQALFAFFPIVLTLITVLGLVLHGTSASATIKDHVVNAFPSASDQKSISDAFDAIREHTGVLAIVSLLSFVYGGSRLFGAVDEALDALYPVKPRSFIRQNLMAVSMMFVFTLLVVPVVMSASILPALETLVPDIPRFLTSGVIATLLQLGVGIVLGTVLFLAMYVIVPNRRVRLRDVVPGAVLAGVLLEVITLVFPIYFKLSHGFAAYGQTFALLFLLMNFFSWMGMTVMIGGAVNAARDPSAQALPDEERRIGGGFAQPEQPGRLPGEAGGGKPDNGPAPADERSRAQHAGAGVGVAASAALNEVPGLARAWVADLRGESERGRTAPERLGDAVGRRPRAVWLAVGLVASRLPGGRGRRSF